MIAKEFVVPKWVKIEEDATDRYARFIVEPFERGYGTTIGNALRRILLASLAGSAVTAIRLEGTSHEFSAVPGIEEDVTDIVLNFKKCQLKLNRDEPLIFTFKHKGQGEVTAGEVFKDTDVDVFNPDQVIFKVTTKSASIEMEIKVDEGRGYVLSDEFELEHAPLGTIYLDANFSPVTKVNFLVEDARVGQRTDYDRLLLDVWTNGSITPDKAVEEAANLLIDHVKIFVKQDADAGGESAQSMAVNPETSRLLNKPIEELELSVRAANCLKAENVATIGDLVSLAEADMMEMHNFGKKSLEEVKSLLEPLGLSLGMKVPGYASAAAKAKEANAGEESE